MKKQTLVVLSLLMILLSACCNTAKKENTVQMLQQEIASLEEQLAEERKACDEKLMLLASEKDDQTQYLLTQKNLELERLLADKERYIEQLMLEKESKISSLEQAQLNLEESLQKELRDYQAKLEMTERGLVITFLAEIFFDSGKDIVKEDSKPTLGKVATVLRDDIPDSPVAIEGHTDSDPIKYSGWKSNWELSTARSLAVLHYFTDEGKITPQRLSAIGHGEFKPITSNATAKGKQQNRRVEIVILPEDLKRIKK